METRINRVHLQRDLDLSKTAYCNFQKLRFFGLVAKVKGDKGYWLITRRGGMFIHGKQKVNRQVLIFRNHIKERSPDMVGILEVMTLDIPYWPAAEWFMPVERENERVEQMGLF